MSVNENTDAEVSGNVLFVIVIVIEKEQIGA